MDHNNHTINVLYIEDDEDDYLLVNDIMTNLKSINLLWVTSIDQALVYCNSFTIDVIIICHYLDGSTCFDFLDRQQRLFSDIPVIIASSNNPPGFEEMVLQQGACCFIKKENLSAETLIELINSALAAK